MTVHLLMDDKYGFYSNVIEVFLGTADLMDNIQKFIQARTTDKILYLKEVSMWVGMNESDKVEFIHAVAEKMDWNGKPELVEHIYGFKTMQAV